MVLSDLGSRMKRKMKGKVQIKVKGHLDKEWEEVLHGMRFSYEDDNTILTGSLQDDAQLHGILNTIRDLNLKLISVNPLDTKEQS
jgi:hypothetical protein